MTRTRTALFSVALALALPVIALTQAPGKTPKPWPKHESQAQLQKEAKVSLADAEATALKAVPGSTIASHELERENGKLIYSFDMKGAGQTGIDEVNVDAVTGAMVDKSHESPADEAKEAAMDEKEAKITLAAATATAQKAVPNGKIVAHELERENGRLIYSFDFKVAGKSGIDEVAVDALTGAMLSKSHESPADEAREAAADKKAMAKPPV